ESPGYCWPFHGSHSEVLIRLPIEIRPKAVTIQHAPQPASSLETISSAPRDFTVSVSLCQASQGLDEEDNEEILLGTFTYTAWHEPSKTFPLQNGSSKAFRVLKLIIWSSWGKTGYTCIYRVEVQGKITEANAISPVSA
ncbi:SUN2 protein, partial [Bucorvus abyssinicus]|nr:SUN2 protein [Bucorvus abyssinicus]